MVVACPVGVLELNGWQLPNGGVDAVVIVPVDPTQRGELNVLERLPRASLTCGASDEFGLVVAVHRLSQRIVVAVTDRADRGHRVDLGQAFAVANGSKLGDFNWSLWTTQPATVPRRATAPRRAVTAKDAFMREPME